MCRPMRQLMSRTRSRPDPPPPRPPRCTDAALKVKGLRSFTGRYRTLHLTWFAFFLSFVVWFNFAPFAATIADQFG